MFAVNNSTNSNARKNILPAKNRIEIQRETVYLRLKEKERETHCHLTKNADDQVTSKTYISSLVQKFMALQKN